MFINLLNFKEIDNNNNEWSINDFSFGKINLIVGKNSTGKSRTLNVISALGGLVAGEKKIPYNGKFNVYFKNYAKKIQYFLEYKNSIVSEENLIIDNSKLSISEVVKRVARIVHLDEYQPIDLHSILSQIKDSGYNGYIGLEFKALGSTEDILKELVRLSLRGRRK